MAQRVDISLDQGATFEFSFTVNDSNGDVIELSEDYSVRAQMRRHYTSTNAVSFTCEFEGNNIVLSLTSIQTANINSGRYVYDCELVDDANVVTRVIEGVITVTPNVTR